MSTFEQLISSVEEKRNQKWEEDFFQLFPHSKAKLLYPEAKPGQDNWPYLFITSEKAVEPVNNILHWLADKGIGLVVNPQKELPDYVFTYGMLWHWQQFGHFVDHSYNANPSQDFQIDKGKAIITGPPSKEYLPEFVKKILRQFWHEQGVHQVRVLVVSSDEKHYDLCFSIESLGKVAPQEQQGICEAISWFLPNHYSVVLISEKGLPPFHSL